MKIDILFSSSDGNACRISNGTSSILIDCGVSMTKLFSRGRFPVDAIFVTHEHGDHIRGVGIVGRNTGATIYIEKIVYNHITRRNPEFFRGCRIHPIEADTEIEVKGLHIKALATWHDSKGGLFYVVSDLQTGRKYAHLTDTGIISNGMMEILTDCNAMLIEANNDPHLLEIYPGYPVFLKNRIKSDLGHLSNHQTIEFLKQISLHRFHWITFGHLSPRTNRPDLIMDLATKTFPDYENFHVAPCRREII